MPIQGYHRSRPSEDNPLRNGVLVLSGYGLRVQVRGRYLVCEDGWCDVRRTLRFHRATCRLKRLVILGRGGLITLEALRWLLDIGAGILCADLDGTVLLSWGPRALDDARLRRVQALAATNGIGLVITRELLLAKLEGQARVLEKMPAPRAAGLVRAVARRLEDATSLEEMRLVESQAGLVYWDAWKDLPVRWATADARKIPDHWKTVGQRISPITGSPRCAATPIHAVLNLLYALLEAEATIACWAVGLDPGLGILHADQPARASMALDAMEPARPAVDEFVLDLVHQRAWSRRDFEEVERGQVRVLLPLARELLATSPGWATAVAPWAERVAQRLAQLGGIRRRLPTPLTEANRSAGREGIRRRPPKVRHLPELGHAVCERCGELLEGSGRRLCPGCESALAAAREAAVRISEFRRRDGRFVARVYGRGYRRDFYGRTPAEARRKAEAFVQELADER